jgi:hypothetical protein
MLTERKWILTYTQLRYRGGSRNAERPKTKSGARSNVQGSLAGGHDDDSASGSDEELSVHSRSGESELVDDDSDQGSEGEVSGSDVGSSGSGLNSDDSENSF